MRCLPALVIGFILVGVAFFHAPVVAGIDKDPYLAGIEALKAGDLDKAIGFLSEAISRNPNDHRYYNDRGVAYKRSGNLELAMSDYGKALEIKPEYANAWNNRGVVYLAQGRYDEAINDLAKALRYGGLDDKVYVNMGCAYAQKGDYASALDQFNKAVAVGSTDHRVFVLMGETLEQMGASERALKVYQLAMDLAQDRQAADEIEKRISTLQKGMPAPGPDRRESSAQVDRAIQPSSSREGPSGDNEKAKQAPVTREAQARKIVRARPLSEPTPAPDAGVGRSVEKGVENYEELASRCQSRAL
ncbi:MAG: tetratricopeptide repeat protein, partial [Deltaproteobacteria bacterium]|nr:tetratricopeptide repeat protein [Deltaproteobacteria bacterium]